MSMTDQERPQRERTQPQEDQRAAHANRVHASEQRTAAAAVNTAVAAARVERTRARHLGADVRRLAEAFEVLSEQINGRDEMGVLEPGNVLRFAGGPEQGAGNMAAVCEFVARIMHGQLPYDAIEEMHEARLEQHLAPAVRHADATYQRAHQLEHAASVPAALPSGAGSSQAGGLPPLPRRSPGASLDEPMVPPAPPESSVQATGQIARRALDAMLAAGHEMPASEAAFAALNGHRPDESFGPAVIPSQRDMRDTQPMRLDEVLGHLALDDAGVEPEVDPEPRPFSGTGLSGDASPVVDSEAGDDDER